MVDVVTTVTAGAVAWQRFAERAAVARHAADLLMFACERKVCVMIMPETYFTPAGFIVALLALVTVAAKMDIVSAVAALTCCRGGYIAAVAGQTG